MKKLILIATVGVFGLISCKKDYSCTCTYSGVDYYDDLNGPDQPHPYSGSSTFTIEGANKTQATAACNEATIKAQDGMDTYEETCTLSK